VASERTGDYSRAVVDYQQAIGYDETYPEAHLFLGNALYKQRRDDEALASWGKAIEHGGGGRAGMAARQMCAILYNQRGDESFNRNDISNAAAWWRKAIDVAPGTPAGNAAQDKLDKTGG
jgi:tetratricopeptide (TPR) repeat protein